MRDTLKIRSKLVDIVTAGSQKITLWGPQRTPLGILRVNPERILPDLVSCSFLQIKEVCTPLHADLTKNKYSK